MMEEGKLKQKQQKHTVTPFQVSSIAGDGIVRVAASDYVCGLGD
jgi:hypothetical protein